MGFSFDRNDGRRKGKNGGFYVAVGLCCAAVCLVALSSAMNSRKDGASGGGKLLDEAVVTRQTTAATTVYDPDAVADDGLRHRDIEAYDELTETETVDAAPEIVETAEPVDADGETVPVEPVIAAEPEYSEPVAAVMKWGMPADGGIISGFSNGELVYCSTMSDWRVHNGVDIACEPGGAVKAAANGEVFDFVEDPLFGWTLMTEQADGSMLYYCGLSSRALVAKGAEVGTGDIIGYLGEVPCESGDQPHLHLAMIKDGDFIDPASVISA